MRFGYCPYHPSVKSPGDRRRFPTVASKLDLGWEIYQEGSSYDVIYVTSNADLTHFSRWPMNETKIVFEMVDSYLEAPALSPKALVRGIGKWAFGHHRHLELSYHRTIESICRRANLVVCSTPEQRARMSDWNENIHCILDMHEEVGLPSAGERSGTDTLNIFWEGLGQTTAHFAEVAGPLRQLAREHKIRLHLVTDLLYKPINAPWPVLETKKRLKKLLPDVDFYLAEWNSTTISALASACDLAILPINSNDRMARSKPENRLLIAWHLGLPVIASDTPAHSRLMHDYGGHQWLCSNEADWLTCLREAAGNNQARNAARSAGLAYAHREHSTERLLEKWQVALSTLR